MIIKANNPPTTSPDPMRLRSGAAAIREIVGPDAVVMNAIADGLENDADRLEMGEPVTDLQASLDLADSFASEAGGEG